MSSTVSDAPATLRVEVAYGEPEKQALVTVEVPQGATVAQAIEESRIDEAFPELEVAADRVGIFGRKVSLDHVLRAGDRVEIYRPLIADPKAVRRARAEAERAEKKA